MCNLGRIGGRLRLKRLTTVRMEGFQVSDTSKAREPIVRRGIELEEGFALEL